MNLKKKPLFWNHSIPAIALACRRKDTPLFPKMLAGLTLVYAISPIDFIPDFITLLGYADDIVMFPFLMTLCSKFIPEDILRDCEQLADSKKKEIRRFILLGLLALLLFILFNAFKKGWLPF